MSTILKAQQKNATGNLDSAVYRNSHWQWKMALFIALLVIIGLLSALIFMLLKPQARLDSPLMTTQTESVIQATPLNKQPPIDSGEQSIAVKSVQEKEPEEKLVTQVSFATKPLPRLRDALVSNDVDLHKSEMSGEYQAMEAQFKPLAVEIDDQQQTEDIDYSQVSDQLQQRFQQALLLSKDEGRAFIEDEESDGMDIHQMASDFQVQVSAFSYDFHVYSSEAKERWIRINGEDLAEGQFDRSEAIQVVEIQPNRTIFRFGSQSFSLQSLTDWRGL